MLNKKNNENIIIKSQIYNQTLPNKEFDSIFAKTISYNGIQNKFFTDLPEIIEEEKIKQEYRNDINKFTKIAISDLENDSHNKMVEDLFNDEKFINDLLSDDVISDLVNDEKLLSDLDLI